MDFALRWLNRVPLHHEMPGEVGILAIDMAVDLPRAPSSPPQPGHCQQWHQHGRQHRVVDAVAKTEMSPRPHNRYCPHGRSVRNARGLGTAASSCIDDRLARDHHGVLGDPSGSQLAIGHGPPVDDGVDRVETQRLPNVGADKRFVPRARAAAARPGRQGGGTVRPARNRRPLTRLGSRR